MSVDACYFRLLGRTGRSRLWLIPTRLTRSGCRRFKLFALRDASLLDHLVGGGQQRFRDDEAERLGGLEVDDELEAGRLHDRQVDGLLALVWGS